MNFILINFIRLEKIFSSKFPIATLSILSTRAKKKLFKITELISKIKSTFKFLRSKTKSASKK